MLGVGESPELQRILQGKRVVLIGRSLCLHTTPEWERQGEAIDSYDLVARVNFPSSHGLKNKGRGDYEETGFVCRRDKEALGTRTEILFSHMLDTRNPDRLESMFRAFHRAGGVVVVASFPHFDPLSHIPLDFGKSVRGLYAGLCPMSHSFYSSLVAEIGGSRPFSGTCAIAHLLSYDLSELRLLGFSFHLLPGEERGMSRFNKRGKRVGHYLWNDFNWLKKRAAEDTRINLGLVLGGLFGKY